MTADEILRRGIAFQKAGDLLAAARAYGEIVAQDPSNVLVLQALGVVLSQMNEHTKAIDALRRCATLAPHSADVMNSLGMALFPAGEKDEAIACFEKALALDRRYAKAADNLGTLHLKSRELAPAREAFERALRIRPDYLEARANLAQCFLMSEEYEKALEVFEDCLRQNPRYFQALDGSAEALQRLERYDEGVALRRQILSIEPRNPARHIALGQALQKADRHADAIECFNKAIEIDPHSAQAHTSIGVALMELGRLAEAARSFSAACRLEPSSYQLRHLLGSVTKAEKGDGTIERLELAASGSHDRAPDQRAHLHFALAKAFADTGDDARAFEQTLVANRLRRTSTGYDVEALLIGMERAEKLYALDLFSRLANAGHPSRTPVFIIGMPRTGSTLVEQILAGHPDVIAIGESVAFRELVQALSKRKGLQYPESLTALDREDIAGLGADYLARAKRIARARMPARRLEDEDVRIVDKLPGNHLFAGLIHLALPNARFVHTKRDPIETCLSCFRVYFESLHYANDLGELGRYFRHYEGLMQRWRELLPAKLILDVEYERLVDDFETNARAIVAHCGLAWNNACLSFRDVSRPVRTASVVQVRQPLYRKSIRTWRPSEEVLRPLLDALAGHENARP